MQPVSAGQNVILTGYISYNGPGVALGTLTEDTTARVPGLAERCSSIRNSAAEFFAEAKCSISSAAHKFGDWVKSVFICTDSRSSDAGKPADNLSPEVMNPQQPSASPAQQKIMLEIYKESLPRHIGVLRNEIEGKTQIGQRELENISARAKNKSVMRDITSAMKGLILLKGLDKLSDNAKKILETKLTFDGLDKGVTFCELGSVDNGRAIWNVADNETFTEQFKPQVEDIFNRIEKDIIPLLASPASGFSGNAS